MIQKFRNDAPRRDDRGASLVEFTLAFPIVALLVFGIVDFARYYAVTGVLRAGAEAGINQARKIPNFDVNLAGLSTSDKAYVRYVNAREKILDETEVTPLSSLVTAEANPSAAVLRDITVTDNGLAITPPATAPTLTRSAAVLRPGECANIAGHGPVCNGPVGSSLTMEQLLEKYPIRIVLLAEVQPFLPFLQPMIARGEAYGERENVPRGPEAGPVDPAEAGPGNPDPPLPPVLPASGAKEPPQSYVNCIPDAREMVRYSMTVASGKPFMPNDVGPPGVCPPMEVPANGSL